MTHPRPVYQELLPTLSPLVLLRALAARPYPCLLESGCGPEGLGRRSFVASDPFLVVHAKGRSARLSWPRRGRVERVEEDPFELLRRLLALYPAAAVGGPLEAGGAIGYFGYELYAQIEAVKARGADDLGMPDLFFAFYDAVGVFDRHTGRATLAVCDWGEGEAEGLRAAWRGARPAESGPEPASQGGAGLTSNFTPESYRAAVRRVKEYIAAGDIYQANLSQRFAAPFQGDPLAFYERLSRASPAPFGACLFPDGFAVLSNSPERYLKIDGDRIETRPIKGTRPRGRTAEEDAALAAELRASEKDRAEHVMIVDLERNDLGRVCEYRSVHVPEFGVIESYANVHHLVSTVAGRVGPSAGAVDCIRNSFPGGSITGAPKVRALEVIGELEPTARGVYCGSIGYIDFAGRLDLSIAIRTAVAAGGRIYFQVGGGVVADSDPAEEYEETITKAQSFLRVLTGEGRLWQG